MDTREGRTSAKAERHGPAQTIPETAESPTSDALSLEARVKIPTGKEEEKDLFAMISCESSRKLGAQTRTVPSAVATEQRCLSSSHLHDLRCV